MMIVTRNAIRGSTSLLLRRLKSGASSTPRPAVRMNFKDDERPETMTSSKPSSEQEAVVASSPVAKHPATQRQIRSF